MSQPCCVTLRRVSVCRIGVPCLSRAVSSVSLCDGSLRAVSQYAENRCACFSMRQSFMRRVLTYYVRLKRRLVLPFESSFSQLGKAWGNQYWPISLLLRRVRKLGIPIGYLSNPGQAVW